ncbi:MAG: hypothetical protein WCB90_00010 [Methanosarcina sp.]
MVGKMKKMKKTIIAVLMVLIIGAFGAAVVSAVASDDAKANYARCGFGQMNKWAASSTDSGSRAGSFSSCPYFNSKETVELKVETIDKALGIARAEIDDNISKEEISQMGRWWIVSYEDKYGVSSQARIDAVTGEVFTGYSAPGGPQAGGRRACGSGFCRAAGY